MLTDEEKQDKVGLEKLVSAYLFIEREPLNDDIVGILKVKPKLFQRKSIVARITEKILHFVDTFINGLPGLEE